MGLPRSTFYHPPPAVAAPDDILVRIGAICDEFECYGYRRLGAALRQQGVVMNGKKLRRLMREHGLQPRSTSYTSFVGILTDSRSRFVLAKKVTWLSWCKRRCSATALCDAQPVCAFFSCH